MPKRFLAFAHELYEPGGGFRDFVSDHDTVDQAISAAHRKAEEEAKTARASAHVVDLETLRIVWHEEVPKHWKRGDRVG